MASDRLLRVIRYDYVRDLPRTAFPKLNGTLPADFRDQVAEVSTQFEMASLESAVDFMAGEYRPRRDLCLLTFDGGLKEHYTEVTPILYERRIRGVFFPITGCLEEKRMTAAHMTDFLVASLGPEEYAETFSARLAAITAETLEGEAELRDRVVREIFAERIGDEPGFAESLYFTWEDARKMQKAGMAMGGQSHQHKLLATLNPEQLTSDLETCHRLLHEKLLPQPVWAFAYPYGKKDSFHLRAVRKLQELNFRCAFSTEANDNRRGCDRYMVGRMDCKRALVATAAGV